MLSLQIGPPPTLSLFAAQGMDLVLPAVAPANTPFLLMHDMALRAFHGAPPSSHRPRVATEIQEQGSPDWIPVYDPDHPGPPPSGTATDLAEPGSFLILSQSLTLEEGIRGVAPSELWSLLAFPDTTARLRS